MSYETREAWLAAAAVELSAIIRDRSGLECPAVRIGVGWPAAGRRSNVLGECWVSKAAGDGINEIVIRITATSPTEVLAILTHELIHAALDCQGKHSGAFKRAHGALGFVGSAKGSEPGGELDATLVRVAEELGAYPGAQGLNVPGKGASSAGDKQTTRMIKVECDTCGFTFRASRQWLDRAAGLRCPDADCEGAAHAA